MLGHPSPVQRYTDNHVKKAHYDGKETNYYSSNTPPYTITIHDLCLRKDSESTAEVAAVVLVLDKALAVGCDHVHGSLG